ncbi:MAG: hypothetical protein KGQ51_18845 [Planctomycetes bacterium]|nr:hypothetical protein [Planctomycetota bacterium]
MNAVADSWRDRETPVPSFKQALLNMTKEQVKAKLGPPDDSSEISWDYRNVKLRDADSGKTYQRVTIWFQESNNTRVSSFSFLAARMDGDQPKNANRSKRVSVPQFKQLFTGKSKAEVKAFYGPPDDSSEISWDYGGMNVYDPDSEKTYRKVTFWFQDADNTRASSFSFLKPD